MPQLHPQFTYDHNGAVRSVILTIDEFRVLLDCAGVSLNTPGTDGLRLDGLAWNEKQVFDARMRMKNLEEDWDSEGMEAYDAL